jgi:trimeric autotransporter adhesin
MKQFLLNLLLCKRFLLLWTTLILFSADSFGQITYIGSATNPADNAAPGTSPVAVTPPAMVAGDLVVMISHSRVTGNTHSLNVTGGQTWTTEASGSTTNSTSRIFWCRFNGTWAADPSVSFTTATTAGVVMHVFRPTLPPMLPLPDERQFITILLR